MWTLSDIGVSGKSKNVLPVMAAIFNLPLTPTSDSVHIYPAVWLYHENMGVAFEISLPFCVHAEIYVFQVQRPPSWIFHFRLHPAVLPRVQQEWLILKMGDSLPNCFYLTYSRNVVGVIIPLPGYHKRLGICDTVPYRLRVKRYH